MTSCTTDPPQTWNVPKEAAQLLRSLNRQDLAEVLLQGLTPIPILTPPKRMDLLFVLFSTEVSVPPDVDNLERYEALLAPQFQEDADGQAILAALRLSALAGTVYVTHDDAVALRLSRSAPEALLAIPLAPEVFRSSIREVAAMVTAHGTTQVRYAPEDD